MSNMTTKKDILIGAVKDLDEEIDYIRDKAFVVRQKIRFNELCNVFELLSKKAELEREIWLIGILQLCRTGR